MFDFIMNNPKFIWAVASIIGFIVLIASIIRFHLCKNYEQFNLIQLFAIDANTGKASDSKVRLNIAFIVSAWAFVFLTMNDKLSEWFFFGFMGAWVTDRFLNRWTQKEDK